MDHEAVTAVARGMAEAVSGKGADHEPYLGEARAFIGGLEAYRNHMAPPASAPPTTDAPQGVAEQSGSGAPA